MLVERDRMAAGMAALGWLVPIPTESNFVLFQARRAGLPRCSRP